MSRTTAWIQLYQMHSEESVAERVRWRMIAGNNRCLAVSAVAYRQASDAEAAIRQLLDPVAAVEQRVWSNTSPTWSWGVRLDGELRAESSRSYGRRVEALASMQHFLDQLAHAPVRRVVRNYRQVRPEPVLRTSWALS